MQLFFWKILTYSVLQNETIALPQGLLCNFRKNIVSYGVELPLNLRT